MRKVLPSITTLKISDSSWEDKIKDIRSLGLREVALFLTGLNANERHRCYQLLEDILIQHEFTIPFVHAITAMPEAEYRLLIRRFDTQWFNLHPEWEYPLVHRYSNELRQRILIENSIPFRDARIIPQDIIGFRGICFDLAHLAETRHRVSDIYDQMCRLPSKFQVVANHISAVTKSGADVMSTHLATQASDFAYLAELPSSSYGSMCAIELDNSLEEQLLFLPEICRFMKEGESKDQIALAA